MNKRDLQPGQYIQLTSMEKTYFVISREDILWERCNCYLIDNNMNICNYNPSTNMIGFKVLPDPLIITEVTDPVSEIGQETIDLMLEKARRFAAGKRSSGVRTFEDPEAPGTDETENTQFQAFCNLTRY